MLKGLVLALVRFRHVVGIPSALVVAAVVLANTATDVILNLIQSTKGQMLWLGVLASVTLLLFVRWNKTWKSKTTLMGTPGTQKLSSRKGLVVVLGLDSAKAEGSLGKLLQKAEGLEWIAFIGTPQTKEANIIQTVKSSMMPALGRDLPETHIRAWEFGNAESLADAQEACTEALQWLLRQNLKETEIVVDITNGRRPMGYGAMTAADALLVESQYLAFAWDHASNTPITGKETFKVVQEFYSA